MFNLKNKIGSYSNLAKRKSKFQVLNAVSYEKELASINFTAYQCVYMKIEPKSLQPQKYKLNVSRSSSGNKNLEIMCWKISWEIV